MRTKPVAIFDRLPHELRFIMKILNDLRLPFANFLWPPDAQVRCRSLLQKTLTFFLTFSSSSSLSTTISPFAIKERKTTTTNMSTCAWAKLTLPSGFWKQKCLSVYRKPKSKRARTMSFVIVYSCMGLKNTRRVGVSIKLHVLTFHFAGERWS